MFYYDLIYVYCVSLIRYTFRTRPRTLWSPRATKTVASQTEGTYPAMKGTHNFSLCERETANCTLVLAILKAQYLLGLQ